MKVKATALGNEACLLRVRGAVDMSTTPAFRRALYDALKMGHRGLILSMGAVHYMDSAGIAVLIEGVRDGRKQQTTLVLAAPSEAVCQAVGLAQLADVFTFTDDERSAVEVLGLDPEALPPPDEATPDNA